MPPPKLNVKLSVGYHVVRSLKGLAKVTVSSYIFIQAGPHHRATCNLAPQSCTAFIQSLLSLSTSPNHLHSLILHKFGTIYLHLNPISLLFVEMMPRHKVPPEERKRTAHACRACRGRKQKV